MLLSKQLLQPLQDRAGESEDLSRLFTTHFELLRCMSVMVQVTSTTSTENYDQRILDFTRAAETWCQITNDSRKTW